jgi:hypothetical protein
MFEVEEKCAGVFDILGEVSYAARQIHRVAR